MKTLLYWFARFVYRFNNVTAGLVDKVGTAVGSTALYVMVKFGPRPKVEAFLEGELRRNAEAAIRAAMAGAGGSGVYVLRSAPRPPAAPAAPPLGTLPPADGLN